MTIRNLDALFEPKAIALIGASNKPQSIGEVVARNLFAAGFEGPIFSVNPRENAIHSTLAYHSIADLPQTPDLAVICTPPQTVPGLIAELGQRGCRAAVVITAGFGEGEAGEGKELRQQMLDAARPHMLRIVGPNCVGFISPHKKINGSFAHLSPSPGGLAFLTQSGAVATTVLDWATSRNIGISHMVSLGDCADIDFGDLLDYIALDWHTNAILLYVESITNAQKFMTAARIASRNKPVVVIKSGRSEAGAKAALSHTGALAGADKVYDAALRRAGMLRVDTLEEVFDAIASLATGLKVRGDRITILTNGGGLGVLATDAVAQAGGRLTQLSPATIERLNAVLPVTWSHGNPVDIIGDAHGDRYSHAIEALLAEPEQDAMLILNCPVAVADSTETAEGVVNALPAHSRTPVLTCWLGELVAAAPRRLFAAHKLPSYSTPEEAVRAFGHLLRYNRNQKLLFETPPSVSDQINPDRKAAKHVIDVVLAEGRTLLTEPEAKAVLSAYEIPVAQTLTATNPEEAARAARQLPPPYVVKILSRDISHKTDVGGVVLDLATPEAVSEATATMLRTVAVKMPKAHIDGVAVESMITGSDAIELLAGITTDPVFGPVLLFGRGGVAAELIGDRAIELPPLDLVLARDMIERTQVSKLLHGYRGKPAADLNAIALTLVRLSQMVIDLDELVELDINPLLADNNGVRALDARIGVRPRKGLPRQRMAIRPYPAELEHTATLKNGESFFLRPIRAEDADAMRDMLRRSSAHDVRMRFLGPVKQLDHTFAARLSQINYHREMALIAMPMLADGKHGAEICGAVWLMADPDNVSAEYAVMVRSDIKGHGIGHRLMVEMLKYAKARGLKRVVGDVLRENTSMLDMAKKLGFKADYESSIEAVRVTVELDELPVSLLQAE